MKEKLNKIWHKTKSGSRRFAKESGYFLTSTYFLKNLGLMVLAAFSILLLTWLFLSFYTDHGESVEVGKYVGLEVETVKKQAADRNINVTVTDSIFVFGKKGGTVQDQSPRPGARVKENRTVSLITYKHFEDAKLPRLTGNYDFERYKRSMASKDFALEIEEEVFDPKQAAGTIMHLMYDGKKITENDIEAGYSLPRGSELSAVITKRSSDFIPIPNVVCQTYAEAEFMIAGAKLVVGQVLGEVSNRNNSYVDKQVPEGNVSWRVGEAVTLYLTDNYPEGCR